MNGDPLDELEEAWAEVKRLRLTDEERDAISYYIDGVGGPATRVATLRGLLDRTQTGEKC